jgi:formate-dependent nitrite reductase membrane component NrfD
MGHLGGLISGVLLGYVIIPRMASNQSSQSKCMKASGTFGMIACVIYFVGGFLLFFTIRTPKIL